MPKVRHKLFRTEMDKIGQHEFKFWILYQLTLIWQQLTSVSFKFITCIISSYKTFCAILYVFVHRCRPLSTNITCRPFCAELSEHLKNSCPKWYVNCMLVGLRLCRGSDEYDINYVAGLHNNRLIAYHLRLCEEDFLKKTNNGYWRDFRHNIFKVNNSLGRPNLWTAGVDTLLPSRGYICQRAIEILMRESSHKKTGHA